MSFDTFLEKQKAVQIGNNHTSLYSITPLSWWGEPSSNIVAKEKMHDYTDLIYKDVFGKNITGDDIKYKIDDDRQQYEFNGSQPSDYKPDISPKSSFIEVKVDKSKVNYKNGNYDDPRYHGGSDADWLIKRLSEHEHNATKSDTEIINYMNDTLKPGNPLFDKIDINKDGHLSGTEIQDYFDMFKHKGTEIYHGDPRMWECIYPMPTYPTADTNKISVADLTNIYALKHNAIITDTLFSENNNLSYEDIEYKSIIKKDDFDMLDLADGKKDGRIQMETFEKFGFDIDKNGIIDQDEYAEGMDRTKEAIAGMPNDHTASDSTYTVDPKNINNQQSQHQPSTPESPNIQ